MMEICVNCEGSGLIYDEVFHRFCPCSACNGKGTKDIERFFFPYVFHKSGVIHAPRGGERRLQSAET